jgi:hypothetical protein
VTRSADFGEDPEDANVPNSVDDEIVTRSEAACSKNISTKGIWVGVHERLPEIL